MGGPAQHVSVLNGTLDPARYETLLVSGRVGPGEASMALLADHYGARHELIASLGPEMSPPRDLRALMRLVRIMRRFRPDIVHTHTAKAGALGRTAALVAARPRPVLVHTFHGHVLEGYFGPARSAFYLGVERLLGRVSDRLIGVSEATVDELVRLRVAQRSKFRVVRLGLELDQFRVVGEDARQSFRREAGARSDDVLFTYVGRVAPIKRLDLMLRALARARSAGARARLAIVGDGELRGELEALAADLGLQDSTRFLGYRTDLASIAGGSDAALLSSDAEGTPLSLIEAAAAGRPAVATAVGGVPEVVADGAGLLVPPMDEAALAAAIERMAADAAAREEMGRRARSHVAERFAIDRLLADMDALYTELMEARRLAGTTE